MIPFTEHDLDVNYLSQIIAYRAFSIYESKEKNRTLFINFMENTLRCLNNIRESKIVYDEQLWEPDRPQDYDKIMRVYFQVGPVPRMVILQFDFNQDIFNGVFCVSDEGIFKVNLFPWGSKV